MSELHEERRHKIRGNDPEGAQIVSEAIGRATRSTGDRVLLRILTMMTPALVTALGFMVVHWMRSVDRSTTDFGSQSATILERSRQYADAAIANHDEKLKPYINDLIELKKTVPVMAVDIARIRGILEEQERREQRRPQ